MTTTPLILTLAVRRRSRFIAVHVNVGRNGAYADTSAKARARYGRMQTFASDISPDAIRELILDDTVRTYDSYRALCEDMFTDVQRAPDLDVYS